MTANSHLVDTSIFVDVLRGFKPAVKWLASLEPGSFFCSVVTLTELMVGVRSDQRKRFQQLVNLIEWLPVYETEACLAGEMGRKYRRSHELDVADLLIAATAVNKKLAVWTRNIKHFPMLDSVSSPY